MSTQNTNQLSELKGQTYVKKLCQKTLEQVRLNHENGTDYVRLDLVNQANSEKNTIREYRGRYIFELLQNANDAIRDQLDQIGSSNIPEQRYRIRLDVTKEALIVSNDGIPFQEKDVESISMWGESSKDPNKSIGYKGIGFKSVLEITESPQIFSQLVQFHFDWATCYRRVRAIVGKQMELKLPITRFVFPFSLEQVPEPDRHLVDELLNHQLYSTVIRLPIKPNVPLTRILGQIDQNLDPSLLLFLNGIDVIEVWVNGALQHTLSRSVLNKPGSMGKEITLKVDEKPVSRWLLFDAEKIPLPKQAELHEGLPEEIWKRVKLVGFSLAFPLDEQSRLLVDSPSSKFYVYFPTGMESGLRYRVHGDFHVDAARKSVVDLPYNKWLASEIASYLQTILVPELVQLYPNDERLVNMLFPRDEMHDFAGVFLNTMNNALKEAAFVPTTSGLPVSPSKLLLAPDGVWAMVDEFHHFFPEEKIRLPRNGRYEFLAHSLYENGEVVKYLIKLGANQVTFREIFKLLDSRAPASTTTTYIRFYDFLWRWRDDLSTESRRIWTTELENSRCIITSNNEWVRPSERIYHAKLKLETPFMPPILKVNLVHPDAYGQDGRESATFRILSSLTPRVREYDAPEIIRNTVLPLFLGTRFRDSLSTEERVQVYRYLFDYWKGRRGGDIGVDQIIGQILVPAKMITNRRRIVWLPASQVYLSSEWTGDNRLEKVFEGLDNVPFLYEVNGLTIGPSELQDWKHFWNWLGLSTLPRLKTQEYDHSDLRDLHWSSLDRSHPYANEKLWEEYVRSISGSPSRCSTHGSQYLRLKRAITIDHLSEILESREDKRLVIFYELLSQHWSEYTKGQYAQLECYRSGCYVQKNVDSYWLFALKQYSWIPAARYLVGADPIYDWYKPSECWVIGSLERAIARSMLPSPPSDIWVENRAFCRQIGMRFMDEAKIDDLLDLLIDLPQHYPDPNITLRIQGRTMPAAVSTLTRWVIERIYNLLQNDPMAKLSKSVPLVAQQDEHYRYVYPPDDVYYADNRHQLPVWRNQLPFPPLNDDWREVAKFLGIKFLSDYLTETVDPGIELAEATESFRKNFRRALPYMLALVAEQSASVLEDVVRYLNTLEIIVVDSLVVNRTVRAKEPISISDPNARVYLEVRAGQREGSRGSAPRLGRLHIHQQYAKVYDLVGAPLANFIRIPNLADAFVILLDRGPEGRKSFISSRGIADTKADEMRALMRQYGTQDEPEEEASDVEANRENLEKHLNEWISHPPKPVDTTKENVIDGNDKQEETKDIPTPALPPPQPPTEKKPVEFPKLDLSQVTGLSVGAENLTPPVLPHSSGGGGGRGYGNRRPNWEMEDQLRNAYGARGEEVAYRWELERLKNLGIEDPESVVVWFRKIGNEMSNHDLESIDLIDNEWVEIDIEVKATPSSDFTIYMSREELEYALRKKRPYRLYRITNVASASPSIFVYENPYDLWTKGLALIETRDTTIYLPRPLS